MHPIRILQLSFGCTAHELPINTPKHNNLGYYYKHQRQELSPTSGRALFFPFAGVYSALPQKKRRCFHCILQRGCKAVRPGTWFILASGYLQALVSYHNGGKPEGATIHNKMYTHTYRGTLLYHCVPTQTICDVQWFYLLWRVEVEVSLRCLIRLVIHSTHIVLKHGNGGTISSPPPPPPPPRQLMLSLHHTFSLLIQN